MAPMRTLEALFAYFHPLGHSFPVSFVRSRSLTAPLSPLHLARCQRFGWRPLQLLWAVYVIHVTMQTLQSKKTNEHVYFGECCFVNVRFRFDTLTNMIIGSCLLFLTAPYFTFDFSVFTVDL